MSIDCWVAYRPGNDPKNTVIEGPFSWEQAKLKRKQIKVDVGPYATVSIPFRADSREEAMEKAKQPHLW